MIAHKQVQRLIDVLQFRVNIVQDKYAVIRANIERYQQCYDTEQKALVLQQRLRR